ncbi:MAG: universal stress protein [Nitrospinota bacterium]
MVRIRKILVATGGSAWSKKAVEWAAGYAKEHGLELLVLHVVPTEVFTVSEANRRRAEKILASSHGLAKEVYPASEAKLMRGPIADTIAEVARMEGCDLIVMGSHGRSKLRDRLLGDILSRVIVQSHCPVLVVKETKELEQTLRVGKDKVVFR